MRKHALILIHGMGLIEEGWLKKPLSVLKNAFSDYPILKNNFEFDDQFEVIDIRYDDQFERLRKRWKEDFAAFRGAFLGDLDPADSAQSTKIGNKLDEVSRWIGAGEDEFIWTHAMDVILYRFFTTVRMAINVSVGEQILAVAKDTAKYRSWNVIAHSLGTSVFHNTLHALYQTELVPGEPPLSTTETRPNLVAMIANVSRVLQLPGLKVFESRVKPGSAITDRACAYYLNARHRLDLLTMPKPFEPDADWVGATVFNSDQYQHIRPGHVLIDDIAAVHDFDHYLRNPRVHAPIFRALLGADMIPDPDFIAAKTQFDSQINQSRQDKIRSKVEKMLPAPTGDWQSLIRLIKKGLSK